jgi:hypothetical protein
VVGGAELKVVGGAVAKGDADGALPNIEGGGAG